MLTSFSLLLALVLGDAVDSFANPRRRIFSGSAGILAWRAAAVACIWLLAFGLTARPLFALVATLVTIGTLVVISNTKQVTLREPLVFSDFALMEHIWRHPHLFYVPRGWPWIVPAGAAALIAAVVVWLLVEPRGTGAPAQAASLALAAASIGVAALWPSALAAATRHLGDPDPESDLLDKGLLFSLMAYYIGWRLDGPVANRGSIPTFSEPPAYSDVYDAVAVIQAEAFIDLRRLGYPGLRLPAFDRLRDKALSSGLLEVPCQGAYTLRPESSAISGRGFAQQGFDRFHPYLRPRRLAADALPQRLHAAGWDTLFIHPHDASFFRRSRAIPLLGFARFADETAFARAPRVGPHVADQAVAEFLLDALRTHAAAHRRLFAYAVTMEAHDPYGPGRFADEADPIRQYVRHIENTDRMLAQIADALDAGRQRILLVFFGDHVPYLPGFADPFPDTRTDYLVVELGRPSGRAAEPLSVTRPEHLHALICRLAAV